MKWYKKQLDSLSKKAVPGKNQPAGPEASVATRATALKSPRQTKKIFAKGVNAMAERNKNRPKTDLY